MDIDITKQYLENKYGDVWPGMVRVFWGTGFYPEGMPPEVQESIRSIRETHGDLWLEVEPLVNETADEDRLLLAAKIERERHGAGTDAWAFFHAIIRAIEKPDE